MMEVNKKDRMDIITRKRYTEEFGISRTHRKTSSSECMGADYSFMWARHAWREKRHMGSAYVYYYQDSDQENFSLYIYSCESASRRDCSEILITKDKPLPKELEEKLYSVFRYDAFDESVEQAGYLLRYMNDTKPMVQCLRSRYPEITRFRNMGTLLAVLPLVMYYIWNDRDSIMGIVSRDERTCFIAPYLERLKDLNIGEKTSEKIIGIPAFALERYNFVFAHADLSELLREKQARVKVAVFMKRMPDIFDYVAFSFPTTADCIRFLSERETNRGEAIDILSFVAIYAFSRDRWLAYKEYLLMRDQIPFGNELPEQIDLNLEEPESSTALLQIKKIHRVLVGEREFYENLFRPHASAMLWLDKDLGDYRFRAVVSLEEMWKLSIKLHVELWQTFKQVTSASLSIVVMHRDGGPFEEDVLLGISDHRIDWTCGANKRKVTDEEKDVLLLYSACMELVFRTYTFSPDYYDPEFP